MAIVRRTISRHAAPLRRAMTDAERSMWFALRDRRLGGYKFRRQWTIGDYVVDFCCLEVNLVVEIDGGQHNEERDRIRTRYLRGRGFRILRYWNNDVMGNLDGVLETLLPALEVERKKKEGPRPNPLPQAGEGQ
ncbi:endonuclease domain-containing protein [Allosphingosinicella humi]